jgi:hypothetical protein
MLSIKFTPLGLLIKMELEQQRREYLQDALRRIDLPADPLRGRAPGIPPRTGVSNWPFANAPQSYPPIACECMRHHANAGEQLGLDYCGFMGFVQTDTDATGLESGAGKGNRTPLASLEG